MSSLRRRSLKAFPQNKLCKMASFNNNSVDDLFFLLNSCKIFPLDGRPVKGISQQNACKNHRIPIKKSFRRKRSVEGVLSIEVPLKIFSIHVKYVSPQKIYKRQRSTSKAFSCRNLIKVV